MSTLEQVEDETKHELAFDLLQIIIQNNYSEDIDALLNGINNQYLPTRRRWYDKDETVHSVVKMLKFLSNQINGDDKKDLLQEFFYSLVTCKENLETKIIEAKS
jgi:hypothetical protein